MAKLLITQPYVARLRWNFAKRCNMRPRSCWVVKIFTSGQNQDGRQRVIKCEIKILFLTPFAFEPPSIWNKATYL